MTEQHHVPMIRKAGEGLYDPIEAAQIADRGIPDPHYLGTGPKAVPGTPRKRPYKRGAS